MLAVVDEVVEVVLRLAASAVVGWENSKPADAVARSAASGMW